MIIFGSRVYGKKDLLASYGTCEQCGVYGPQRSYNGRRWGHIYWIPIIPEGPKIRILQECKACKHARVINRADIEASLQQVRNTTDRALSALLAGQNSMEINGSSVDPVNEIGGALDFLLALGDQNYVKLLVAALRQQPACEYACRVCEALWAEFEGDLDAAEKHFLSALRISHRSTLPSASLARLYMHGKKYDAAETVLDQALAVSGDPGLHGLQAVVRTRKGDPDGAANSYETFFRILPGAALDKGLYKDYRKVCKKAGRKPLPTSDFA